MLSLTFHSHRVLATRCLMEMFYLDLHRLPYHSPSHTIMGAWFTVHRVKAMDFRACTACMRPSPNCLTPRQFRVLHQALHSRQVFSSLLNCAPELFGILVTLLSIPPPAAGGHAICVAFTRPPSASLNLTPSQYDKLFTFDRPIRICESRR